MLIEAGSWLTLAGADGPEPASMSASAIRTADALTCPTCLLDTPDGYCSCCGATVKYEERGPKAHAGRGATLKEEHR